MTMPTQRRDENLYLKAVFRLLRAGARSNLKKVIEKSHPSDLAWIVEKMPRSDRREFIPLLIENKKFGDVLMETKESFRHEIVPELDDEMLIQLLNEVTSDDAVDLLEPLSQERI